MNRSFLIKGINKLFLVLLGVLLLSNLGCASLKSVFGVKKSKVKTSYRSSAKTTRAAPDYSRPARVLTAQQRAQIEAANNLIGQGKSEMEKGDMEAAKWSFEEALRLAYFYGPPYFWLAQVFYELGDSTQALNFLSKAEKLLQNDESWMTKLVALENKIQQRQN